MHQHLDLLGRIITQGFEHDDRTTVGRKSLFGVQYRFDMKDGFPLTTTREINTKALVAELLWFIKGSIDIEELKAFGASIWDKWAVTEDDIKAFIEKHKLLELEDFGNENMLTEALKMHYLNSIGPMYGAMWRNAPASSVHMLAPMIDYADIPSDKLPAYQEAYQQYLKEKASTPAAVQEQGVISEEEFCQRSYHSSIDQLNNLVVGLRKRPHSSRHVVSVWIPELIPDETISPQENVMLNRGSLAPCHNFFQCFVTPSKEGKPKLSLSVYIRSNDIAVGFSYNIAQYAMLLHMLAQVTDMEAHELIYTGGDVHLYSDQMEQAKEQLAREPLALPKLKLNPDIKDIFKFTADDISIEDYSFHPAIRYPVAK